MRLCSGKPPRFQKLAADPDKKKSQATIEVAILTKKFKEYFKEFPNTMPKTKIEMYKIGRLLGSGG